MASEESSSTVIKGSSVAYVEKVQNLNITNSGPLQVSVSRTMPARKSVAILYANVKCFSILSKDEQTKAMDYIIQEIEKFLGVFDCKLNDNCWLDLRSGDFQFFIGSISDEISEPGKIFLALLFGLRLQVCSTHLGFRIGITVGQEYEAKNIKISNQTFLVGKEIDEAPMLMSFSHADHFFLSSQAYEPIREMVAKFIDGQHEVTIEKGLPFMNEGGQNWLNETKAILAQIKAFRGETFNFYDHHNKNHAIYNFVGIGQNHETLIGNQELPFHRVAVERRPTNAQSTSNPFKERLISADKVTIIGSTNENLVKNYLEPALKIRNENNKGFWKELRVVFPSESVLTKMIESNRTLEERRGLWELGRMNVYRFLLAHQSENWQCLEFDGMLPFWGNSFDGPDGASVRIAPILPGLDLKETYYTEFFQGMPAFEQVRNAISLICSNSISISEWLVFGRASESKPFVYEGLANSRHFSDTIKKSKSKPCAVPGLSVCTPVVIIALYADMEVRKSVLQFRTIYNASNDFHKYSNISGRLTSSDVLRALYNENEMPVFDRDLRQEDKGILTTREFNRLTHLHTLDALPEKAWQLTARRELWEELGLRIENLERLHFETDYYLERDDGNIYFKIFSLKLCFSHQCDELEQITDLRPNANLRDFTLEELIAEHKKETLNRLLQRRFHEVFLPIFDRLGIGSPPPENEYSHFLYPRNHP